MGTDRDPVSLTEARKRGSPLRPGEESVIPPEVTDERRVVAELRDGLLQDLIAAGLLLQVASDPRAKENGVADQALEAARELIEQAPDKLRSALERLSPP